MADKKRPTKVKIKKGTFYISSKEDKGEGWERNEFTLKRDGADEKMVRYHKELSLEGTVQYMGFQSGYNDIEIFSMIIRGEDESFALEIPVVDGGKVETINSYLSSIAGSLGQIKKGDKVTMFVNNKFEDKNGRLYKNIVILDANGEVIKNDFDFKKDVPRWTSETTKNFKGEDEVKWDASETNAFFYKKIKTAIETFGNSTKKQNNEQSQESVNTQPNGTETKFEPIEDLNEDDYDDLPF